MTIHILYNLTRIKNVLYTFVQQNTAKVIESYCNILSQRETKLRWIILMTCIIGNMEEFPYLNSEDVDHLLSEIIKFTKNKSYIAPWSNLELLTVLSRLSLNHHIRKHILLLHPLDIFSSILKYGEKEEMLATIDCMYSLSKEESFSLSIVDNRECFTILKNLCAREHEECIKPIRRLFWRMASENSLALKFDSLLSETFPISFNVITQEVKTEIIGKGAFGTVRLICNQDRPYEKKFVAKSIPSITDEGSDVCNREISILTRIRHKRIVPFHGFMKNKDCIDIFFEYMTMGTLTDYIKSRKQLDEKTTRLLTSQILEGVNYLHEQNVIHRDIKGSNILMKNEFSLKISDFGLSKLTSNNTTTKTADVGTIRYMAPEVIKAETDTCHKYKQNVDIWSVGCTVVEMVTGSPPNSMYEEHTVVFKLASHIKPEYTLPDGVSNALRKFISRTLEIEPEYRPHAKTLLEYDEFITGVSKQYDYINIILTSKCLTDELEKYGFEKQLTSFTAVKYFSVRNIPPHYEHRQYVVQLIHAIVQLTVLIGIEYKDQGETKWKFCSGMLYLNSFERFTEDNNKVCSCFECQNSDSRILDWVNVEVVTSARVLGDVKVNSFYVRVGFDDDENQGYVLSGIKIMNCDEDSDRCTLACSCHDVYLFTDLQSTWTNYIKLQNVREFFKSSRDKHRLTVTVCHPFGCCKHLSFGEWLDKKNIQQVPLSASYYTRYCYTTPLCTGCEGAPVIILGSGIDTIIHAHSYTKNDVNYTGTGLN